MSNTVEKDLDWIEKEVAAQKKAFSRAAYSLSISTRTASSTLVANEQSFVNTRILGREASDYYYRCKVITLATNTGINTIAKLITNREHAVVRRVPYNGGAKWVVRFPIESTPIDPTNLSVTVYSTVPGTLNVEDL